MKLVSCLALLAKADEYNYVRQTTNGPIKGFGYDESLEHSEIYLPEKVAQDVLINEPYDTEIYQGIPYAQPPTGNLRWRPPKPAESWDGEYDATYTRASCARTDFTPTYGEDCLYLNVFVPKAAVKDGRKVAVGVWLHGGGFEAGAGGVLLYDGRFWAAESTWCW